MGYVEWIRNKVGKRKIFLPKAAVILHNKKKQILLLQNGQTGGLRIPEGVLEAGEDIITCARRKLLEETGQTAGELQLVGLYSDPKYDVTYSNGDQVQQYMLCFRGTAQVDDIQLDNEGKYPWQFYEFDEAPFEKLPLIHTDMVRDSEKDSSPAFSPPFALHNTVDQIQDIRPIIGTAIYHGVGSAAVLVNKNGHLLMAQRTDNGYWHFPGGYMHIGENASYTVIREIKEETGLTIHPYRIMGVMSPTEPWIHPNGDQVQGVVTFFQSTLIENSAEDRIQPDKIETLRAEWVPPKQVMTYNTHPNMAIVHKAILEHLNGGCFII